MVSTSADTGADYVLFGGGMALRDKQSTWFLTQAVLYQWSRN
jgi:hypothetical protein